MLINIDSGAVIDEIPHRPQFDTMRRRLSSDEFEAVIRHIDKLIDAAGGEIATAGWLPGSDWTGTPLEPIYSKAAHLDQGVAGRFFGQMVWYTVMNRPERWASGKYQKDGVDIGSRTYFRLGRDR